MFWIRLARVISTKYLQSSAPIFIMSLGECVHRISLPAGKPGNGKDAHDSNGQHGDSTGQKQLVGHASDDLFLDRWRRSRPGSPWSPHGRSSVIILIILILLVLFLIRPPLATFSKAGTSGNR